MNTRIDFVKDLTEKVFKEKPLGYAAQGELVKVCKLNQAIYGLKQSPKTGFEKFIHSVTSFGFNYCKVDPLVFIKHIN